MIATARSRSRNLVIAAVIGLTAGAAPLGNTTQAANNCGQHQVTHFNFTSFYGWGPVIYGDYVCYYQSYFDMPYPPYTRYYRYQCSRCAD